MGPECRVLNEDRWRNELEQLTSEYEDLLAYIDRELPAFPEGTLVTAERKGKLECYCRNGKERTYLPSDQLPRIKQLAQKEYYRQAKQILEKQLKRNHYILSFPALPSLDSIVRQGPPAKNDLFVPLVSSGDDYARRWLAQPYEGKPFREGDPVICAKNGMRVRSKSEAIIIDLLLEYEIPFKYECPLHLKGMGDVYPDFRVLNKRTGEEFVWEHFGKVDEFKYANDTVRKLEAYHFNGFFEGRNLLCTWESSKCPFGPRDAKRIIETYLV